MTNEMTSWLTRALAALALLAGAYVAGGLMAPFFGGLDVEAVPTCEANMCNEFGDPNDPVGCTEFPTGPICGICTTYEILGEEPQQTNCTGVRVNGTEYCSEDPCSED